MRSSLVILALLALAGPSGHALDANDEDALKDTQKLLGDEAALRAFAKDNPDALNALGQVDKLTQGNKAQKTEVNAISSDIFASMVKDQNGDSGAIQAKLREALKDPKGFMNSLTPEQQARIRGLASELEKQNAKSRSPSEAR